MLFSIFIVPKFLSGCLGIVIFSSVFSGIVFKIYSQVFPQFKKIWLSWHIYIFWICTFPFTPSLTLMLGKTEGRRRRGWQRMRWLDGTTDSMDRSLGNFGSWRWTGRPGVLRFTGSQRVRHDWATELNWTGLCQRHQLFMCWPSNLPSTSIIFSHNSSPLSPALFTAFAFQNEMIFKCIMQCSSLMPFCLWMLLSDIFLAFNLYPSFFLPHPTALFFYPCWPGFYWRCQRISWVLNLNLDTDHS